MSGEEERPSREEFVEREHQADSESVRSGQSVLRRFAGRLKSVGGRLILGYRPPGPAWLARMVYDGAGSKAGSLRAAFELIAAFCIRLGYWVGTGLVRKSIGNQRCFLVACECAWRPEVPPSSRRKHKSAGLQVGKGLL